MNARVTGWACTILLALTGTVAGQNADFQGGGVPTPQPAMGQAPASAYPDQPVMPQGPSLGRRAGEEQSGPPQQPAVQNPGPQNMASQGVARPNPGPPQPPFVLTPAEELELDRLLLLWENSSQNVKTFRAKFCRFEYNPAVAGFQQQDPNAPIKDLGELRYQAPDKGLFSIDPAANGDRSRVEKWVCDGKSLFQYDEANKKVYEFKLPPESQGKGITNGPMPFLFGAKAKDLKHRYWMRKSTQQPNEQNKMVLEVHPKFLADAQNFKIVEIELTFGKFGKNDVMPTAVQLYHPGGKARTVYVLGDIAINKNDIRGIFEDPFNARIPSGWQKVVESNAPLGDTPQRRVGAGAMPAAMGNRGVAPR